MNNSVDAHKELAKKGIDFILSESEGNIKRAAGAIFVIAACFAVTGGMSREQAMTAFGEFFDLFNKDE